MSKRELNNKETKEERLNRLLKERDEKRKAFGSLSPEETKKHLKEKMSY